MSGLPSSINVTAGNTPTVISLNGATQGYLTITASASATVNGVPNTQISTSIPTQVLGFTAGIEPDDDFAGRSYLRLGVGETGVLGVVTAPGVSLNSLEPLTWTICPDSTGLAISNVDPSTGSANFTAGETSGVAILSLSDVNLYQITITVSVVEPTGLQMQNQFGTTIWHVQNTASVGFFALAYLQPTDVSFRNIQVREFGGVLRAQGSLAELNGQTHATSAWAAAGSGNVTTGCSVTDWHDKVGAATIYQQVGSYTWPAIWQYQINSDVYQFPSPISQTANVTASGSATVFKAGHSESANWGDIS